MGRTMPELQQLTSETTVFHLLQVEIPLPNAVAQLVKISEFAMVDVLCRGRIEQEALTGCERTDTNCELPRESNKFTSK